MISKVLADDLLVARKAGTQIDDAPALSTVRDAIDVQDAVMQRLGVRAGGWKVGINKDFGPIGAPMFEHKIVHSPASWTFEPGLMLEVEIAVRLGRDLPAGTYDRAAIIAAIESMSVGVEIVRSRLAAGGKAPFLAQLADSLGNEGFVMGNARLPWVDFELNARQCIVRRNGQITHDAVCSHPLMDPLLPFAGFASHQISALSGLKAGQIVTTGSVCGLLAVPGPGVYSLEIEGIGTVDLAII